MTVPYWVQDAIFYQIFPDRFANGDLKNDPVNVQPWGSEPTNKGYQGGDLRGIIQRFEYLLDLGVNAIYLNPIFQSSANHRYHTTDYFKIDPFLGNLSDFKALLDISHQNNIKLILDGVFNHTGRGFFAFNDILENGPDSPYKNWFSVRDYPLDAYGPGEAHNYLAWWGIKDLPKLNTDYLQVRNYLLNVAKYWIDQGIDGWRLDVPGEIDDDSFWQEFRETVKTANPDAYLVGEIWDINPRWVGDTHFDGLMHYPLRDALRDLVNGHQEINAFSDRIDSLLTAYPKENTYAMMLNLDSHDTKRIISSVGNDLDKAKLMFYYQFSYPGCPTVYYGDEIGLEGSKDPYNRSAFPWYEPNTWNVELRNYIRNLITLRKTEVVLRRGDYRKILVNKELSYYVFSRSFSTDEIVCVMNSSSRNQAVVIPVASLGWSDGTSVEELLTGKKYIVQNGGVQMNLSAWSGYWLKKRR
ncbi:MAG: glycoside hydrolase family 13 protein [Anaerolineales bacterium]|nr:glycoside hydrolase family 13 protein [Anaerolineales bacterium]